MPILPIVVIVDVDPDWRIFGAAGAPQKGEMRWEGLRRGVPNLLRLVEGLRDSRGAASASHGCFVPMPRLKWRMATPLTVPTNLLISGHGARPWGVE